MKPSKQQIDTFLEALSSGWSVSFARSKARFTTNNYRWLRANPEIYQYIESVKSNYMHRAFKPIGPKAPEFKMKRDRTFRKPPEHKPVEVPISDKLPSGIRY